MPLDEQVRIPMIKFWKCKHGRRVVVNYGALCDARIIESEALYTVNKNRFHVQFPFAIIHPNTDSVTLMRSTGTIDVTREHSINAEFMFGHDTRRNAETFHEQLDDILTHGEITFDVVDQFGQITGKKTHYVHKVISIQEAVELVKDDKLNPTMIGFHEDYWKNWFKKCGNITVNREFRRLIDKYVEGIDQ